MIDGIKIYYRITDFETWKKAVNIELFTPTELDTGAMRGKIRTINGELQQTITYKADFEKYRITIKETTINRINGRRSVTYLLILDGSLHKNHFSGANYLPFTWDYLQKQITHLETSLHLSGKLAELVNLEIGLNISLPFPVFPFLKSNLISYKGNSFNQYPPDSNGVCLGYYCPLSQYTVKVYDKGVQFKLPENVMRFELRFLKMQKLKELKIKTLLDLKNYQKVHGLLSLLLDAWDNVLLSENLTKPNIQNLKPKERELLEKGSIPKYWELLKETDTRRFNYKRTMFKKLVSLHGTGWHEKINELIKTGWETLFENCTILPGVQNPELSEFTVKVKGKNVQDLPHEIVKRDKEGEFSYTKKGRSCLTCGRDISNQDGRSKFCSAKFVGEAAAHQCRNRNSNPRNNFKNKVKRINGRGVLFDIIPFLIDKNSKKQPYAI